MLSLYNKLNSTTKMTKGIIKRSEILVHILAGKCTFTIESIKTLTHFTYKVIECKDNSELFFIYVLCGPNNTSDFKYIGTYTVAGGFKYGRKSKIAQTSLSIVSLQWVFANLMTQRLEQVNFYHEGTCCKCGKKLTTPDSVLSGIGPVCQAYFNKLKSTLYNKNL